MSSRTRKLAAVCVALMAILAIVPAAMAADCPGGVCTISGVSHTGPVILGDHSPAPVVYAAAPVPLAHGYPPLVAHAVPCSQRQFRPHHAQQIRYRGSDRWTIGFTLHRQCGPQHFQHRWH